MQILSTAGKGELLSNSLNSSLSVHEVFTRALAAARFLIWTKLPKSAPLHRPSTARLLAHFAYIAPVWVAFMFGFTTGTTYWSSIRTNPVYSKLSLLSSSFFGTLTT